MAGGAVTAITVTTGGSRYTSAPVVTVSAPPSGTSATATATVSGGVVTGITVKTPGSGYTAAPTITIARPPAIPAATATATSY